MGRLEAAEAVLGNPLLRATRLVLSLKYVARTAHSTVLRAQPFWRRDSGTVSKPTSGI